MAVVAPRTGVRRGNILAAALAVSLALMVLSPVTTLASPARTFSVSVRTPAASGGLSANASWDGTNISTASTASSAFHISFGGSVNVYYSWRQPTGLAGGSAPWSINDARLQIFYFGFALGTRDITLSAGQTSGNISMSNWNTGPLEYVLEGLFLLTASLLAPNGTTAWSQSFWVDVAAAFYVLAALPIVLLLLGVYELYSIATVGKQQALKRAKSGGGKAPENAEPAPSTSPPPASSETADAPTAPSTPPEGGGST